MDCIWLQTQKLNGLFQQKWLIFETRMAIDVVLLIGNVFVCFDFLFTFSQNEGVGVSWGGAQECWAWDPWAVAWIYLYLTVSVFKTGLYCEASWTQ